MLYLTIEDIVSNSIIELEKLDGRTNVLIDDAKRYGEEVAKHLTKRGYYTKLKLNPGLTESFDIKYSNYFSKYYENTTFGYQLVDGKSIEEVISIFRSPLVDEVVESFTCEEVIENSIGKKDNYIVYEKAKVLKRIKDE